MSGCGPKQAGSGICAVTLSKSLPAIALPGPPMGEAMLALLSSSQSGGPTFLGTCAVTRNADVQPGGTFTGAALMSQVSTGPTWPQVHGPIVVAAALTPSVSC